MSNLEVLTNHHLHVPVYLKASSWWDISITWSFLSPQSLPSGPSLLNVADHLRVPWADSMTSLSPFIFNSLSNLISNILSNSSFSLSHHCSVCDRRTWRERGKNTMWLIFLLYSRANIHDHLLGHTPPLSSRSLFKWKGFLATTGWLRDPIWIKCPTPPFSWGTCVNTLADSAQSPPCTVPRRDDIQFQPGLPAGPF